MNIFEMAKKPLDDASKLLKLDAKVSKLLAQPEQTLEVSIPVKMDDGSLKVFTGYRSQHSTALGPAKGGIRFHQNVTIDEVKTLAFWMSCKCAVLDLPYGGGKGGVIVDPRELSANELERLSRKYIEKISPLIGPDKDIPAPDVNTNSDIMAIMVDEYSKYAGHFSPETFTGKPKTIGGSAGRGSATGRGVMFTAREALKKLNIKPAEATCAVQGFGNVGSFSAKLIYDLGVKIVALSDVGGGIYCEKGLNPYDVAKHVEKTGSVVGFKGTTLISNEDLLSLPVTLLVPAALECQITMDNVNDIKAKLIVEGANGPTTPDATDVLSKKGVMVVPDILANAGGVTVSYFEWVQNRQRFYWTEDEVNTKLEQMMVKAFEEVYQMTQTHKTNMRVAAYAVALTRIAKAIKLRGWV